MVSFSHYEVERRTKKSVFYKNINTIIDWQKMERGIDKYYSKANNLKGEKPYSGLLLFKMLLIGVWNGLSYEKTEEHVLDSLSAMNFCGLQLEESVPDHSTLSRFKNDLTKNNAFDKLLVEINNQLEAHGLLLKTGVKVDASLTDSPYRPKQKPPTYEIAEDRKEDEIDESQQEKQAQGLQEIESQGIDKQARFLKKSGKTHFGYKKQVGVDENGMVLGVHTTPANEHDSKGLVPLLEKIKKEHKKSVSTDKAYKSKNHDQYLKTEDIKNRIQHKAYKNKPLTYWEKKFNKLIAKSRWVVERTFGSMKLWFSGGYTRLKGIEKVHSQHIMEAIAYNLKRSPNLLIKMAK